MIWNWAKTANGRTQLQKALKLCSVPVSELEANETAPWIQNAISWMAMGSCLVFIIYYNHPIHVHILTLTHV